ncbi:MAG: cupin domain-containing protein [Flavitalea sp.]
MKKTDEFMQSGMIQAYINGLLTHSEEKEVIAMAQLHESVRLKIDELSIELERAVVKQAIAPPKIVKAMFMASIDYMDRMNKGEKPSFPPLLHEESAISDYNYWLTREDCLHTPEVDEMYIKIIGKTPQITTAIVWMQQMRTEMHQHEIEQFLIIEGTCQVMIGANARQLKPGDVMIIAPGQRHEARTTSSIPCKVILQRITI